MWLQHEEERKVATAFMSNLECKWLKEGVKEGVEKGVKEGQEEGKLTEARSAVLDVLDAKFDRAADTVAEHIKRIDNLALLRRLRKSAATAPTLDDFRRLLPSG
jgi:flagellar biosynthesis/type III secretory pathway protein FliH